MNTAPKHTPLGVWQRETRSTVADIQILIDHGYLLDGQRECLRCNSTMRLAVDNDAADSVSYRCSNDQCRSRVNVCTGSSFGGRRQSIAQWIVVVWMLELNTSFRVLASESGMTQQTSIARPVVC